MSRRTLYEIFSYALVGISNTLLNIFLYHFLLIIKVDYKLANIIAIIVSKLYGYAVNKKIVFRSHCSSKTDLIKEFRRFVIARGGTGFFDYFAVIFAVEVLEINELVSKYIVQLIVIILNFILAKFMIFTESCEKDHGF